MLKYLIFIIAVAILVGLVVGAVAFRKLNLDPYIAAYALISGALLIAIVTLGVLLSLIPWSSIRLRRNTSTGDPNRSLRRSINKRLRSAVRHLPRRSLWSNQNPGRTKPVWLVLGPAASGKSTLIQGAPKAQSVAQVDDVGVHVFDSQDSLYVEATVPFAEDQSFDLSGEALASALLRRRPAQPLDGILIPLSSDTTDTMVLQTEEYLAKLVTKLQIQVPLVLVMTHVDRLPGFATFHSDLKETSQPLGVLLPKAAPPTELPALVKSCFRVEGGPESWVRCRALALATPGECEVQDASSAKFEVLRFPTALNAHVERGAAWLSRLAASTSSEPQQALSARGLFLAGVTETPEGSAETRTQLFVRDLLATTLPREALHASRTPSAIRRSLVRQRGLAAIAVLSASYGVFAALRSAEANRAALRSTRDALVPVLEAAQDGRATELLAPTRLKAMTEETRRWAEGVPPVTPSLGYFDVRGLRPPVDKTLRLIGCKQILLPLVLEAQRNLERAIQSNRPESEDKDTLQNDLHLYRLLAAPEEKSKSPYNDADEFSWLSNSLTERLSDKMSGAESNHLIKDLLVSLRSTPGPENPKDCQSSEGRHTHQVDTVLVDNALDLLMEVRSGTYQDFITQIETSPTLQGNAIVLSNITGSERLLSHRGLTVAPQFTAEGWELARALLVADAPTDEPAWLLPDKSAEMRRCQEKRAHYVDAYRNAWKEFFEDIYIEPPTSLEDAAQLLDDLTKEGAGGEPLRALGKVIAANTRPDESRLLPLSCTRPNPEPPQAELEGIDALASVFGPIRGTLHARHTHRTTAKWAPLQGREQSTEEIRKEFDRLNAILHPVDEKDSESNKLAKYLETLGELRELTEGYIEDKTRGPELQAKLASGLRETEAMLSNKRSLGDWENSLTALLVPPIRSLGGHGDCIALDEIEEEWRESISANLDVFARSYPFEESGPSAFLDDVKKYFHPASGEIAKFREEHLQRYLEREGPRFILKDLGKGKRNPVASETLSFLSEALTLGELLFPGEGEDTQAQVAFKLTMKCNRHTHLVRLTVDGEEHEYRCDSNSTRDAIWKGSEPSANLQIVGLSSGGQRKTNSERPAQGDFALFQLFERDGKPKSGNGTVALLFDLSKEGHGEIPLLVTPKKLNAQGASLLLGPTGSGPFLAPFRARSLRNPPNKLFTKSAKRCSK